jgi:uncharacterized protein involved in outer membrane biogenesis
VLTLNPVTGELPGGSVTASAALDTTKEPATQTLTFNAPALALSPLLTAFGLPGTAEGTVQAQLSATSTGDSLQAIATGVNGQFGLAMVNGIVDGGVLSRQFGTAVQTAGLPASQIGAPGPVTVRCMGLRVDAANGVGTIRALALDSSRLRLQGGGSFDLGKETLGVILLPQMPAGSTTPGSPVEIGGSFAAPTTTVAAPDAVTAAGLQNEPPGDVCPVALSLGRLGQAGAAAPAPIAAPVPATGTSAPATSGPKSLLNSLTGP